MTYVTVIGIRPVVEAVSVVDPATTVRVGK